MSRSRTPLADQVLAAAVIVIFGTILMAGLFENPLSSLLNRSGEQSLRSGTTAAYSGTAAVDLQLAHKAIAGGDLAGGEGRVGRAQDKLYAPQLGGRAASEVSGDMKGLEERYGKEFKAIRRKRSLERLGREGAETVKP
ncbi:MAG: hypothetical protein PHU21_00900 [Elusimicrobia bacterium]|nr:hypothetical protein [Elusimicrobiota bacterium]